MDLLPYRLEQALLRAVLRLQKDPNFEMLCEEFGARPEALAPHVCRLAADYWADFDADDFCLQSVGEIVVVFGSLNRLLWSPNLGFRPDTKYCSERFLTRAALAGARLAESTALLARPGAAANAPA